MTTYQTPPESDLRRRAIDRLRKKRGLSAHLLAYLTVNLLLAGIWLATTPDVFFWPLIPMLGWGIGSRSTSGTCTRRSPTRSGSSARCAASPTR